MTVTEFVATKKGPVFETDPKQLERVERVRSWLTQQYSVKKTWKKVAAAIGGYDESSINSFASGSYPGNPEKILSAVEQAMDLAIDREANVFRAQIVETSIAKRIRRAARQTRLRGTLGLISGQSGVGKTTILMDIAATDRRVIYYRANIAVRKQVWGFLASLIATVDPTAGKWQTPVHGYDSLKHLLAAGRKMLILDECQFLSREALDLMRTLAEDAEVPILFAGNESTHEFGMLAGSNPAAYTQFVSRCSVQDNLRFTDITQSDVNMIASQILSEEVLDEVGDGLLSQANAPGGFRRLRDVLQRAHEKATGKRMVVSAQHVFASITEIAKQRGAL